MRGPGIFAAGVERRGVKTEIFEERHEKVAWVLCVPKGRSVE